MTAKNLEDAVAGFRVAEASLAQAQAAVAAARVQLSYTEIKSPTDGWVVAKTVEPGDMAGPGAALFTIEDLSRVKEAYGGVPIVLTSSASREQAGELAGRFGADGCWLDPYRPEDLRSILDRLFA